MTSPDFADIDCVQFTRLKQLIADSCGNVQPIKVRPRGDVGSVDEAGTGRLPELEIVFGYSRLFACQRLGLPVLAIIEELDEREAIKQFVFEYRAHAEWRPWRLGDCLKRAIGGGHYSSLRQAAGETAMDLSEAALVVALANLPISLRRAFVDVQLARGQAKKLVDAYQRDPETVVRNACQAHGRRFSTPTKALTALTEPRS